MGYHISLFHFESSMTANITGGEVVLLLIKLTFLRCSCYLNIPLQSKLLTLVVYITFQHVFPIYLTFDLKHEYLINKYYNSINTIQDFNAYLKKFKVSIKTVIINQLQQL